MDIQERGDRTLRFVLHTGQGANDLVRLVEQGWSLAPLVDLFGGADTDPARIAGFVLSESPVGCVEPHRPAIVRCVSHVDAEVRALAVEILSRLLPSPEGDRAMVSALADLAAPVTRRAASEIARWPSSRLADASADSEAGV